MSTVTISYKETKFETESKYFLEKSNLKLFSDQFQDLDISTIENISVLDIVEYLRFLEMKTFDITLGFYEILQWDTGISNVNKFPEEYFKIKIVENLIRERFHDKRFPEISQDLYYGLVPEEKKILRHHFEIFDEIFKHLGNKNIVIAGGSVEGKQLNDIDIFFHGVNEEGAEKIIEKFIILAEEKKKEELEKEKISLKRQYGENYDADDFFKGNSVRYSKFCTTVKYGETTVQFVKKLFKTPAEVLYGFDIDCCAYLYDGKDVWSTPRAHLSKETRKIYADPDRTSPNWVYRLVKYSERGYELVLPLFQEKFFQRKKFEEMLREELKCTDVKNIMFYVSNTLSRENHNANKKIRKLLQKQQFVLILEHIYGISLAQTFRTFNFGVDYRRYFETKLDKYFDEDKKGLYSYKKRCESRIPKESKIIKYKETLIEFQEEQIFVFGKQKNIKKTLEKYPEFKKKFEEMRWIEDKDTIVTTFIPERTKDIKDLEQWYCESGFYKLN